jgi:predicted permease
MSLDQTSGAHRIWGYLVTGNYWQSLGIKPTLGRFFTAAEDVQPNASPYAVLSFSCWQNRFAGDPAIAGKEIRLNGHPYTVLGVAPAGFYGTEIFYRSDIWVPMMMQPQIEGQSWLDQRQNSNIWVAGRLKTGVTALQAEASLNTIAAQLAREYSSNEGMHLTLSAPGLVGSTGREPTRAFADSVMLLAMLVLLAACANLASLLAARAADRFRELAIRVSIGAGRGRIVRQLLTESLLISILGGAAGSALAVGLSRLLTAWHAPLDFPIQFDVTPDWRVFLFAFAVAVATGVLFGIGPMRQGWKADPAFSLKGRSSYPVPPMAVRDVLLPLQLALCCALVTASLVAARGLTRSFQTPLGFRPEGAAVIGYDVGLAGYTEELGRVFQQQATEAVAQLPGVESAAYVSSVPLGPYQSTTGVYREGTTDFRPKNMLLSATYYFASTGYFQTARTRLLAGREFNGHDDNKAPRVAIVNETFARQLVGLTNAVGRHFLVGLNATVPGMRLVEIVGVVEDGKYRSLTEKPTAALFLCSLQNYSSSAYLIARSSRPESEVAAEMNQAMARLDPHLPIYGVGSLNQMLGFVYLPMHAAVIALGTFGVLAIMLSITGIYGLAAYAVSRRLREIGIRVAIGARPSQVLWTVLGRTGALAAGGAAAGLALGVAGSRLLARIVYSASPQDPVVLIGAVFSMTLVGIAAALGPARRALRVDPVQVIRQE